MAHHINVEDERFIFRPEARTKIYILLAVGVVLFALGLVLAMNDHAEPAEHHGQLGTEVSKNLVASIQQHEAASESHAEAAHEQHHEAGASWVKRLKTTLWMNNLYFIGLGIIGLSP